LTSTSSASPSRSRSSISSAPTLAPSFSAIFSRPLPPRTGTPPGHNRSPADPGRSQRELPRPARAGRRGGARVLGLGFGVGTRGEGRGGGKRSRRSRKASYAGLGEKILFLCHWKRGRVFIVSKGQEYPLCPS
jgi:hypothetical protein